MSVMSGRRPPGVGAAGHARHLARRFFGSLSSAPPPAADVEWAVGHLLDHEAALWKTMSVADQRHSIAVARRFVGIVREWSPDETTRAEVAGALLHDVGKVASGLGTMMRVAAKVVGPRTTNFQRYHDHEQIGADLLRAGGSDPVTVELVLGNGRAAGALLLADNL